MKKTISINLAGLFFHIDEDAYNQLQNYLAAVKRSMQNEQGTSEIIADIEARIAELFSERISSSQQVITSKIVEDIINIMGQPEDYNIDDERPSCFYFRRGKGIRSTRLPADDSHESAI